MVKTTPSLFWCGPRVAIKSRSFPPHRCIHPDSSHSILPFGLQRFILAPFLLLSSKGLIRGSLMEIVWKAALISKAIRKATVLKLSSKLSFKPQLIA